MFCEKILGEVGSCQMELLKSMTMRQACENFGMLCEVALSIKDPLPSGQMRSARDLFMMSPCSHGNSFFFPFFFNSFSRL